MLPWLTKHKHKQFLGCFNLLDCIHYIFNFCALLKAMILWNRLTWSVVPLNTLRSICPFQGSEEAWLTPAGQHIHRSKHRSGRRHLPRLTSPLYLPAHANAGLSAARSQQGHREKRLVRGEQKRKGIGEATRLGYQPVIVGCLVQQVMRRHCRTAAIPTAVSSPPGKTTESLKAALSYISEPEMPSWASRGWVHCCKWKKNEQRL